MHENAWISDQGGIDMGKRTDLLRKRQEEKLEKLVCVLVDGAFYVTVAMLVFSLLASAIYKWGLVK